MGENHCLNASSHARQFRGYLFVVYLSLVLLPQALRAQIVINEIHINPDLATEHVEFVELYNAGASDVELDGWYLSKGVFYQFSGSITLSAGGYLVVAENASEVVAKYGVSSSLVYGPFEGKLSNDGEQVELRNALGEQIDEVTYQNGFPWPTTGDPIDEASPGTAFSIQLLNPDLDNDLGGSWRSAAPTPAAINSVYAANIPPQIRQVDHKPNRPESGEIVTITAKVTDPDGVQSVALLYQLVDPGAYIALDDAAYTTDWTMVSMNDAGVSGDEDAGDDVYTVQLAGTLQTHRRLVRYRIVIADTGGRTLTVPYADDPQPNFAYFVYDGAPEFDASWQPGVEPVETFTTTTMSSLPIYHLITKKSETENCTWFDQDFSNLFVYGGTLVYDGEVYDHIRFRPRGGVWRFAMRKNMWKFDFNRGHYFQARDNYGDKYSVRWNQMNLGACIQQGNFWHRGEQGMFEAVGFALFNLAGIEASRTNFIHFRIVDETYETGELNAAHSPLTTSGTQYDGDFWGLYLATEEVNGRYLDEHNLPDGNLYKMESGWGELKNQGPYDVTDYSDLQAFMDGYTATPAAAWWQANADLTRYYNYRAIVEGIHQYDISDGKNYFYYRNPETALWAQLPWDLDLTWADNMYGDGEEPFKDNGLLDQLELQIEYQNRMREIRDLLYNSEQTGQLIDEIASFIYTPDEQSFVDADRAMWDYHWVMSDDACSAGYGNQCGSNKAGQGRFYQIAATADFAGMLDVMKDYVISRGSWIDGWNDAEIQTGYNVPDTPAVTSTCPVDYPVDALTFETSAFSDIDGDGTFAALQWRIAEVLPAGERPPSPVTLVAAASTWKYFKGTAEPSSPMQAWRAVDFNDASWLDGVTPLGWGEDSSFLNTIIEASPPTYLSIYGRIHFNVDDPTAFESLTLKVIHDDGCNVWINGVWTASELMTSEDVAYNATATAYNPNEKVWSLYSVTDLSSLVAGDNVIAIQIQNSGTSSSDCFFDVGLQGNPDQTTTGGVRTEPGKYEIDATWQSEEITPFEASIEIPVTAVQVGGTYRVRARMKDNTGIYSHWSDPVEFIAGSISSSATRNYLRVSEVMYQPLADDAASPYDDDDYEFIEVVNSGLVEIDASGVTLTEGVTATVYADTTLQPNEYAVIVKDVDAFQYRYGTEPRIIGEFSGKLANSGEELRLADAGDEEIVELEYNDARGWPVAAAGGGHSLVPRSPFNDDDGPLYYAGAWRASTYLHGSPGEADLEPPASVVINEFLAHTDYVAPYESNDWLEIYNAGSGSITLDYYYLSDDVTDPLKWQIPSQTILAGQRLSFDEITGFHTAPPAGFGLSKYGEQAVLSYFDGTSQDRIIDAIAFKGQENEYSLGRYPDGGTWLYPMPHSRNSANSAPSSRLVINEMMYHPVEEGTLTEDNLEYIEIYNPTNQRVDLWNETGVWRLDGEVNFDMPTSVSLLADGLVLIVGFDPSDSGDLNTFLDYYELNGFSAVIWGPWSGSLSNKTGRVSLERPEAPDLPGDPIGWVIQDEVIYVDTHPFPRNADGTGNSIHRISMNEHGSNPANWTGRAPSPASTALEGSSEAVLWMLY
ncbi:lamin tail domain-containing protein [Candidatus Sumerlaeota bacterium]|nr:lamin tail domain-containing protein [Candidatus Sumerlaeota bacterium]